MNPIIWLYGKNQGFGLEYITYSNFFGGLVTLEGQSLSPSTFPGQFSYSQLRAPYQVMSLTGTVMMGSGTATGTYDGTVSGIPIKTTSSVDPNGTVSLGALTGLQINDSRAILIDPKSAQMYQLQK
jgi:hypothetical protein